MSAPAVETPAVPATPPATPGAQPPASSSSSPFAPLTAVPNAPEPTSAKAPVWAEGLNADELAYLGSKGWDKEGKGPADILRSYRNAEKLLGGDADKRIKLPDWSKPDEVAEYRARIGVPESADKYESHDVALPTGVLDASAIAKLSHRIGANQVQHTELLNGTGELLNEIFTAEQEAVGRRRAIELQDLAKEVGAPKLPEFNQDVESAITKFKALLPDDLLDGIATVGEAPFRKFLAAVGRSMRESSRAADAGGRPTSEPATADVAKARIVQLQGPTDEAKQFFAKLESGDPAAKQEWKDLNRIAYGD